MNLSYPWFVICDFLWILWVFEEVPCGTIIIHISILSFLSSLNSTFPHHRSLFRNFIILPGCNIIQHRSRSWSLKCLCSVIEAFRKLMCQLLMNFHRHHHHHCHHHHFYFHRRLLLHVPCGIHGGSLTVKKNVT